MFGKRQWRRQWYITRRTPTTTTGGDHVVHRVYTGRVENCPGTLRVPRATHQLNNIFRPYTRVLRIPLLTSLQKDKPYSNNWAIIRQRDYVRRPLKVLSDFVIYSTNVYPKTYVYNLKRNERGVSKNKTRRIEKKTIYSEYSRRCTSQTICDSYKTNVNRVNISLGLYYK